MFALKTSFDPEAAQDGTYEIRLGDDRFRAEITGGRLELTRGTAERPDAVLATDAATLRSLVFGGRDLAGAIRNGALKIEGDERAVARFVAVFPRPIPAGDKL
jgi:alkyl sulfatase BDS1-like metallo-beta-lactamase superfamily hydrolase